MQDRQALVQICLYVDKTVQDYHHHMLLRLGQSIEQQPTYRLSVVVEEESYLSFLLQESGISVHSLVSWGSRLAFFRKHSFDLVHVCTQENHLLGILPLLFSQASVLVCSVFSDWLQSEKKSQKTRLRLFHMLERLVSHIGAKQSITLVFASPDDYLQAESMRSLSQQYLRYLPLPVQRPCASSLTRADVGLPSTGKLLGIATPLVAESGIDRWLETCSLLASEDPEWQFVVVGDGPEKIRLLLIAEALGLRERVHWLGERLHVPAILELCDAVLYTSPPSPRDVHYAWMAGTPVFVPEHPIVASLLFNEALGTTFSAHLSATEVTQFVCQHWERIVHQLDRNMRQELFFHCYEESQYYAEWMRLYQLLLSQQLPVLDIEPVISLYLKQTTHHREPPLIEVLFQHQKKREIVCRVVSGDEMYRMTLTHNRYDWQIRHVWLDASIPSHGKKVET